MRHCHYIIEIRRHQGHSDQPRLHGAIASQKKLYRFKIGAIGDKRPEQIYACKTYNAYGKNHCTQHRVEYDVLYKLVLDQIRECAQAALQDKDAVAGRLSDAEFDALELYPDFI